MEEKLRLDLYLFRARLFKSRSQAAKACREGRLLLNKRRASASTEVREGDIVRIREKGLYHDIRVLQLPGRNMSRTDAKTTYQDETPEEIVEQRELIRAAHIHSSKSESGRPTKKERRELDKLRRKQ